MVSKKTPILSVIFLSLLLLQVAPVTAHTPGPMTLDYDFGTQLLSVQVTHSVSDVNTHYIYQVVVEKNSVVVLTRDYTTQNTTSGMSATYSISAVHGDVLSITAKCIISGQYTDDVTVVDPSVTTTTPTNGGTTPLDLTLIIALVVVVIGVIAVIFAVFRRR
ncbi:MAG: hypothetical protein ACFFE6_11225 [Candidatus Thorarchaeota archaeon]